MIAFDTPIERTLRVSESYTPFPRQKEFHNCKAPYRLFGGQAGPGKTTALLWEAIKQANRWPKVDTLLMRRTFPELEATLISSFRRDVPRDLYVSYNESKHIVTWHNDSTTRFGYCASENDIYQYQGGEFLFIGVDELTLFTLPMWQFLTSRNRCRIPDAIPTMAGASNPGNIGHAWVKALWIDHTAPAGMERPEQYKPDDYVFIAARLEDNPVYANDERYKAKLDALPTALYKAFRLGDWNVFAGQYFSNWDPSVHVWDLGEIQFQAQWPRFLSVDWGYQHHTVVGWHAQAGTINEDGTSKRLVITYRELVKQKLSEKALAEEIVAANEGDLIQNIYAGHDLWKEQPGDTKEQAMSKVFVANKMPSMKQAKINRVDGWRLMHRMLDEGQWIITRNCSTLISAIPMAIYDQEKHNEDLLKTNDVSDDALDMARYGLYSQYGPKDVPFEQKLKAKVAHLTDMTSRNLQLTKLIGERDKEVKNRGQVNNRSRGRSARYGK